MDKAKRARSVKRTALTLTTLQTMLNQAIPDYTIAEATLKVLEQKLFEIEEYNRTIFELMLASESTTDDELNKEEEGAEEYLGKFQTARVNVTRFLEAQRRAVPSTVPGNQEAARMQAQADNNHMSISNEEKFQYLIQATVENSRASELVNSYPPTAANYVKVIESLKSRFGRDDLLMEEYVRELLKLVLNKTKGSLTSVYDKLETHLRALESLGVTTDMCAAMLFPLVESSLPEEILRAWQRRNDGGKESKERLKNLMKFLEEEVQNEERISMAKSGFDLPREPLGVVGKVVKKSSSKTDTEAGGSVATAAALLVTKETKINTCIFCAEAHENANCTKAKDIPFSKRQEIAKEKGACFWCLKLNHSAKVCRYKNKCPWCGRRHVLLMCRSLVRNDASEKNDKINEVSKDIENLTVNCHNASCSTQVHLQTLRVKLIGPHNQSLVRALIDSGLHYTYVRKDVADRMKLQVVGKQRMVHALFGGAQLQPQDYKEYKFCLGSLDGTYECCVSAFDEKVICPNIPTATAGMWVQKLKDASIVLSDVGESDDPISLLIGADIAGRLMTGKIHQLINGPVAIQTKLGWTLMGRNPSSATSCRKDAVLVTLAMFNREAKIADMWNLDVLGITDPTETVSKEAHLQAVKQSFCEQIKINQEGKYEVNLPWKENHPPLSNNRWAAERRLHKLTQRLVEENLYDEYDQVFNSWLQEDIIEVQEGSDIGESGYFLPHRHVIKRDSTTRIRPVFDASACGKDGPSLNQCLEPGPNLIELIPKILLRFMEHRIGIAADIRKAFLQISIAPADRDVLKFLWWSRTKPRCMIVLRHRRVVFGINCGPFLLGATIEYHLNRQLENVESQKQRQLIEKLKKSFYADNSVTSVRTEEERGMFQQESTNIMQQAGFDLRGWEFTSPHEEQNVTSILGIAWDKRSDCLFLCTDMNLNFDEPITKRKILSVAHKIFDPLGWASPTLLIPKLILQQLWNEKISWDLEVSADIAKDFKQWCEQIGRLQELKMPRWIFGNAEDVITLHMFVDASNQAYTAACFVRVENSLTVKIHLVQAKARVGPVNQTSIPRMELLATTLGARLMKTILQAMDLSRAEITFWTDSSTVLSWLRRGEQWSRFVYNRVEEIKGLSDVRAWRHVPGTMNPADLPSRKCSVSQLVQARWWKGPDWLALPKTEWPLEDFIVAEQQVSHEISKSKKRDLSKICPMENTCVVTACICSTANKNEDPWYLKRFFKYTKVVRTIAWVIRFATNVKKAKNLRERGEINAKEFEAAERLLFRLAQQESFHGAADLRLKALNVYEDEGGLIRTRSLVSNRIDKFGFKNPVVLDPSHSLTKLLIKHTHERLRHAGISTTMRNLREYVWIISSRRVVRSVINKCVICRRYVAKTLSIPPASLPENRVRDAEVFEVVGIDYAGPLFLKGGQKAWVCLFNCAVYRAIHLELVTTLSTEGFLEALKRFIFHRGRPKTVCTDNGTNFVGARNLLKAVDWDEVVSSSSVEKIEWHLNPPSAAWWGGWWERIIRILKDLLKRSLGRAVLSYEEMTTVLCECEAIVNSRPISYESDDQEGFVAITPEMFLKEIRDDRVPDLDHLEKSSISRRLKYRQRLRQEIKARFRSEYLGQLTRYNKPKGSDSVAVGDMVLISSDNQKRLEWPLARIIQLIPGKDGIPRIAKLKTSRGELVRPLQRLVVLEGISAVSEPKTRADKGEATSEEGEKQNQYDANLSDKTENKFVHKSQVCESEICNEKRTRSGRLIKRPDRYL